jgi:hypothetical protein
MPNFENISKDSCIFNIKYIFRKNNFPKILAFIFRISYAKSATQLR